MITCHHCKTAISGSATIQGSIALHFSCAEPHTMARRGLPHRCAKCKGLKRVPSATETETKYAPLPAGEYPPCAWNGCWGCKMCRDHVTRATVPKMVKCDLCDGQGFTAKSYKPKVQTIKKVVGWEEQ